MSPPFSKRPPPEFYLQLDHRGEVTGVAVGAPTYEGLLILHNLAGAMLAEGADIPVSAAMRDVPAVQQRRSS